MIRSFSIAFALVAAVAFFPARSKAADSPSDWVIAGPFGGTATSVAVDPSNGRVVLAGALNSLLYRSVDGGANWQLLDFPKRHLSELTSILIDPGDSKHYLVSVIAADGGGVYESHDCGEHWTSVKELSSFGVRALSYAPSQPTRFAAGTAEGVFLSDDCGRTWSRASDQNNGEMMGITVVTFDPKDASILYAGTSHLPWKTVDGGKTWSSIHTGMIDDSDVFSIYVNPSNPANVLASACSGIYASNDRGDLWKKLMGIPNTSRRTHVIREDPSNASVIYAGTTTGLYKTVNGGASWRTLTNTQSNAMAFDPSNPSTIYTALEYEGIGKSENSGERIFAVNQGFVDRVISAVSVSGNRLVAIETQEGDSTGIFVSKDNGEHWAQMDVTKGLSGVHLKAITGVGGNEKILVAASPHGMYKSIDSGASWRLLPVKLVIPPPAPATTEQKAPVSQAATYKKSTAPAHKTTTRTRAARLVKPKPTIREVSISDVTAFYSYKMEAKDVLFAATDLGLLRSDDLGEHWTQAEIPNTTAVVALYVGGGVNPQLVARSAGGLFVSSDGGAHWTSWSFPRPATEVNDIAMPAAAGMPYLAATRSGLYRSEDGSSWTAVPNGIPASTVTSVIYGSEKLAFAVEYGRLYRSEDGGANWSEIHSALPITRIRQLWKANPASSRIFGLTADLGIIYRD